MERIFVKTEEELRSEFGLNWRRDLAPRWNGSGHMDYLLGTDITDSILNEHHVKSLRIGENIPEIYVVSENIDAHGVSYWVLNSKHLKLVGLEDSLVITKTNGLFRI